MYNFGEPADDSQLGLEFTTIDGLSTELTATGEGCARLMEVYRDRFLANFTQPESNPDKTK